VISRRLLLPVFIVSALVLGGTSCSSDKKQADSAAAAPQPEVTAKSSGGSKASSTTTKERTTTTLTDGDPSTSIDLGSIGDCVRIGMEYSGLYLSALGGKDAVPAIEKSITNLKALAPSDLHGDIDTVGGALRMLAEEGILKGSDATETPEYKAADKRIQDFLETKCNSAAGQ
jgi:hypothetical protein